MNLVEEEKDAQLTFINDNLSTEKKKLRASTAELVLIDLDK